jgi:hypothetical protein
MGSTSTLSAAVKPLRKEGGVSNSPVPSQPARGMRRRRRSQVGDVGVGENAGDVGGLHDRVGAVGRGEGLVVAERVEAELAREGGERQRRQDLGVDGVGQPARPLEARPAPGPSPAGVGVHGQNPRCAGGLRAPIRTGIRLLGRTGGGAALIELISKCGEVVVNESRVVGCFDLISISKGGEVVRL